MLTDKMVLAILISTLIILSTIMIVLGTISITEQEGEITKSSTTSPVPWFETFSEQGVNGIRKFNSYNELLSFISKYLEAKEQDSDLNKNMMIWGEDIRAFAPGSAMITVSDSSTSTGSSQRYSETNVQVRGVDEPDIVKTNGRLLVVTNGREIFVISTSNDEVLSVITLGDMREYFRVSSMFLLDNKLIAIVEPIVYSIWRYYIPYTPSFYHDRTNTSVYIYDLTDPGNPVLLGNISISGFLVGARLVNTTVYIITQEDIVKPILPIINNEPIPLSHILVLGDKPDHYIILTAIDVETITYNSYAYILPPTGWLYVSHNRIYLASYIFPDYYEIRLKGISVLANYLPENVKNQVYELLGKGNLVEAYNVVKEYLDEQDNVYIEYLLRITNNDLEDESIKPLTVFHVFDYNELNISYRGSFSVEGRVLDQFAMEEMNNYFVVATTSSEYRIIVSYYRVEWSQDTSSRSIEIISCKESECITKTMEVSIPYLEPKTYISIRMKTVIDSSNNIFIIDLETMEIIGKLTGLAESERIYSARLIGNILYLVTYRRIDPLFAIDLSDPTNPVILGFLKIPGFSEYLHPINNELLLGIGREDNMLKISLFNISDPANMTEISKLLIENGWSPVFYDHHAFTIDQLYERIYVPARIYSSNIYSGILVVSYKNSSLELIKILEHDGAIRTVYVGNKVYTVSYNMVKIFDIESLEYIGEIELNT